MTVTEESKKAAARLTQTLADLGAMPGGRPPFTNGDTLFRHLSGKTWEEAMRDAPAAGVWDWTEIYVTLGPGRAPVKKEARRAFLPLSNGTCAIAIETPGAYRKPGTVPQPEGWNLSQFGRWADEAEGLAVYHVSSLADGYERVTRATFAGTPAKRERMSREAFFMEVYGEAPPPMGGSA